MSVHVGQSFGVGQADHDALAGFVGPADGHGLVASAAAGTT